MKRQAFEVIAEIEKKFKHRSGCMMWTWSIEHIAFLIKRWQWKTPSDADRIKQVAVQVAERVKLRLQAGATAGWLYMQREQIEEMMIGAGLKPEHWPDAVPEVDSTVVLLKAETDLMGVPSE